MIMNVTYNIRYFVTKYTEYYIDRYVGFLVSDMNIIGNIIYPHLLFQVFHQKQSNISELQKCEVTALSKTSGALTG